jgi:hypothetical protein
LLGEALDPSEQTRLAIILLRLQDRLAATGATAAEG